MYMTRKAKKRSKLRHAEYYDMQNIFDELYAKSRDGEIFNNLVEIIVAPNNIMLAFRNIKSNDGATAGTDGRTMQSGRYAGRRFCLPYSKTVYKVCAKNTVRAEIPNQKWEIKTVRYTVYHRPDCTAMHITSHGANL